jgi:hypothetical protein
LDGFLVTPTGLTSKQFNEQLFLFYAPARREYLVGFCRVARVDDFIFGVRTTNCANACAATHGAFV